MKTKNIPEFYQCTAERVDGGGTVTGQRIAFDGKVWICNLQKAVNVDPFQICVRHTRCKHTNHFYEYDFCAFEVYPETVERVAVKVKRGTCEICVECEDGGGICKHDYTAFCPNCQKFLDGKYDNYFCSQKRGGKEPCGMRLDWRIEYETT